MEDSQAAATTTEQIQDKNYDYRHIHHHFHHHHDSSGENIQGLNQNKDKTLEKNNTATVVTQQNPTVSNRPTTASQPWWGLKRKSPNSENSSSNNNNENNNNISSLNNNVSGITAGLDVTQNTINTINSGNSSSRQNNNNNHLNSLHTQNFNLFRPQPHTFITPNGIHDTTQQSTGPSISPIANIPARPKTSNQPGAAMNYLNQMSNPNMQTSTTNTGNFETEESSPATSGFISGGVHHQLLQRPITAQHTIASYHQQKQFDMHQQHLFQQQAAATQVSYHNMTLQATTQKVITQPEKKSKRSLPVLRKGLRLFNIIKPKERRSSSQQQQQTNQQTTSPIQQHNQSLANIQQLNMLYQQDPTLFFRAANTGQQVQNVGYEFSDFQERLRQQTKQNLLPQLNQQTAATSTNVQFSQNRRASQDFDTANNFLKQQEYERIMKQQNFAKKQNDFLKSNFGKQTDFVNSQDFVQTPIFGQTTNFQADMPKKSSKPKQKTNSSTKKKVPHDPNAHIQDNGVRPDPVAQLARQMEGGSTVQYKEEKDIYQRSVKKVQRWLMSIPDDPCSYST